MRDPRIMADNHTLIFSAITPTGKGKYDLFQSRINADGTWTDARPLDFINSAENDQSPTISAAGDVIFFYTKNDIYAMPIPVEYRQLINVTVQGFVRSEKDASPLSAVMEVSNLDKGEKVTSSNNSNDGRFSLVLAAGAHFKVEFLNPSYLKEVREFDLRKQRSNLGQPTIFTGENSFPYAINSLTEIEQTATVNLGVMPGANGTFSFSVNGITSFDPTSYIYLEDKVTGAMQNLRDNNSYTFNMTDAEDVNRFVIHFNFTTSGSLRNF